MVTYRGFKHKPRVVTTFSQVYIAVLCGLLIFFTAFDGLDMMQGKTNNVHEWSEWWDESKDDIKDLYRKRNFYIYGAEFINWVKENFSTKAKDASIEDTEAADVSDQVDAETVEKKSKKVGFRDRKIIQYEDRIRQYSTPDKIYRYFATLKVVGQGGDSEVYMTPEDFVRSITPGVKQPEGLGLDSFRKFDPKKDSLLEVVVQEQKKDEMMKMVAPDSIFHRMGKSGLISFSDYIFLLVVLSTPPRNFEIGFRMFDFNGDGEVDHGEFSKVQAILRNQTSIGTKHRNHGNTGSIDHGMSSALSSFFFGKDGKEKLTVQRFLDFQRELHTEINKIEFNRHSEDGLMSERDFSSGLLTYAGLPDSKKSRMIKRVRRKYKDEPKGMTFDEYLSVWKFLQNINDVDTALSFYHLAGVSIDQETFKHVASTVAFVDLSDHVIDVIFTLFDEDNDGELSNKEFVSVMKRRSMRGLEKPKDTGFVKLLNAMVKCATSMHIYPDWFTSHYWMIMIYEWFIGYSYGVKPCNSVLNYRSCLKINYLLKVVKSFQWNTNEKNINMIHWYFNFKVYQGLPDSVSQSLFLRTTILYRSPLYRKKFINNDILTYKFSFPLSTNEVLNED